MEPIDYAKELFVADHIKTYTGTYFNPLDPNPDKILAEDIAHALSNIPRYGGHLPKFYSVAQHSLYVARILPTHLKLPGLLHDATEGYLGGDIPSPIKARMPEYKAMENKLLTAILKKFGVFETYMKNKDRIKEADIQALKIEWNVLMQGRRNYDKRFVGPFGTSELIKELFLAKFKTYYNA